MTYPNTNTVLGLAQVIQGEANNPADQFGVASTIANRLSGAFGNFGSTIGSVVTPSQFNGGTTATIPSANATALAQSIFDGNLSQYGNTGNVVYYSASNFSTVRGAANYVNPSMQAVAGAGNTLAPGGNSFSTGSRAGPSLAGTVLPSFGGSSSSGLGSNPFAGGLDFSDVGGVPNITDDTFNGITDEDIVGAGGVSTANASSADGFSLFGTPSTPTGATSGFNSLSPGSSGLGGGSSLFNDAGGAGDSVTANGAPVLQDSDFEGLTDADIVGPTASSATGAAGGAAGAAAGATGGIAVNLTDESGLPASITSAGKAAQTGATTAGSDITGASSGITGTAASIFNSFQSYASGALIIVALVLAGLIFVAFGLGMFKHDLVPKFA